MTFFLLIDEQLDHAIVKVLAFGKSTFSTKANRVKLVVDKLVNKGSGCNAKAKRLIG